MNICLIGYGKMGREIEKIALERGHQIKLIVDLDNHEDLNPANLSKCDVAIDFTRPEAAIPNIRACFQAGIPVVTGTTGWNDKQADIIKECNERNQTLFYSSNFSIGVNIFFAVNRYMAGLMDGFPEYNVRIRETHHIQKLDAPSGTAITIAEQIVNKVRRKANWKLSASPSINEIGIESVREGDIKGIHEVSWESDIELLSLSHSSKSRKGLAFGALLAAEFVYKKKGVYTMRELLAL